MDIIAEGMKQVECFPCSGTGVYQGWEACPAPSVGAVCPQCKGSGDFRVLSAVGYHPYTGRKERRGIMRVLLRVPDVGDSQPVSTISYEEFLRRYPAAPCDGQ